MICVNELSSLKCNKRAILEPLTIVLSPFAPHITEELWHALGTLTTLSNRPETVFDARFPEYNEEYLKENAVKYPISFNGKVRFTLELPADMPKEEVEKTALADTQTVKYLEGKTPKKIIIIPQKIVNILM
jgi:leucyl-tRNA synthetase